MAAKWDAPAGAQELPIAFIRELRSRFDDGVISFEVLGETVAGACVTSLDEYTLALAKNPAMRRDRRAISEVVHLAVLAQQSDLLARYGLPHFAFNHLRSYDKNLEDGSPLPLPSRPRRGPSASQQVFGRALRNAVGVGSSVLTATPDYVGHLFALGYASVTYKTVRSRAYPGYPSPNWVFLAEEDLPSNRDLVPTTVRAALSSLPKDLLRTSTVNSYGVPSPSPDVWQADFARANAAVADDQLLIASVMGSYDHYSGSAFVKDFARVAKLAEEAGATAVELNLSCPNVVGAEDNRPLCERPTDLARIVGAVRELLRDETHVVIKLNMMDRAAVKTLLSNVGNEISAVSGVNTVQVETLDTEGKPLFPSPPGIPDRRLAGLSGAAIKHVGLRLVKHVHAAREDLGLDLKIIGMGGVLSGSDYRDYRDAGSDLVHAVTGVFVNALLIDECVD